MTRSFGGLSLPRLAHRALESSSATFAALVATMGAAGVLMLALGLERLATNRIRTGANLANAPLPYSQPFHEWAPLLGPPTATSPWRLLLVSTAPPERSCQMATRALTATPLVRIVVLRPSDRGRSPEGVQCGLAGASLTALGAPRRALLLAVATSHGEGFSLFSDDDVPIYGSRDLTDLEHVPPLLALWKDH